MLRIGPFVNLRTAHHQALYKAALACFREHQGPVVIPGPTVVLRVSPDELVGIWPSPRRVSRWVVAYAALLELPRHGRGLAFIFGAVLGGLVVSSVPSWDTRGSVETASPARATLVPNEAVPAATLTTSRDTAIRPVHPDPAVARATSLDPTCEARPDDLGGPRGCWYPTGDNGNGKPSDGPYGHDVGGEPGEGRASSRATAVPRTLDRAAIAATIRAAALEFGVDPNRLVAVAMCESSLREIPEVGKAQEVGWLQWLPSTWEWLAPKSGLGYTILDITDLEAQARLTAWAFVAGYADAPHWYWSCAR